MSEETEEVGDDKLQEVISKIILALIRFVERQEPLGDPFTQILFSNLYALYEE